MSPFCSKSNKRFPLHSKPKFLEGSTRFCMIWPAGPHRLHLLLISAFSFCRTSLSLLLKYKAQFKPQSLCICCSFSWNTLPLYLLIVFSFCPSGFYLNIILSEKLFWPPYVIIWCLLPYPTWLSLSLLSSFVVQWHIWPSGLFTLLFLLESCYKDRDLISCS